MVIFKLPLSGSFAEYFKEVKIAQEVNKKVCVNCYNYKYDGYVFVDKLVNLMNPNYLTSQFPQYIQKHGCKQMRFHDLQHPYVKHTTKNISLQKQKSQATKEF